MQKALFQNLLTYTAACGDKSCAPKSELSSKRVPCEYDCVQRDWNIIGTRTIPESYVVLRQVACVPYGLHFEDREALARHVSPSEPTVIVENDGVIITGADVLEAYDRLEVLESTAEALLNCRAVGTLAPTSDDAIREPQKVFLRI